MNRSAFKNNLWLQICNEFSFQQNNHYNFSLNIYQQHNCNDLFFQSQTHFLFTRLTDARAVLGRTAAGRRLSLDKSDSHAVDHIRPRERRSASSGLHRSASACWSARASHHSSQSLKPRPRQRPQPQHHARRYTRPLIISLPTQLDPDHAQRYRDCYRADLQNQKNREV